ncbi:MAG TPA: cyclic nucleotide-binding domain-containing protein [bacterium]
MSKIKAMKENIFFKDLSDKEIAIISQITNEKTIPNHTPIYVERMLGESFYIIKSGSVQISKQLSGTGDKEVLQLNAGDFFGELSLLDGGSRPVSARAIENTELLVIDRDDFLKLIEKEPLLCAKILSAIIKLFSKRIRDNLPLLDEFLEWYIREKKKK